MKTNQNISDLATAKNTVIFMMGAPGSGKSYVRSTYLGDLEVLDCDKVKEAHPEYDAKNPSALHEYSKAIHSSNVKKALNNPTGESIVIDGTGSNADKMVKQMTIAIANGWNVALVYVVVALQTSLKRNELRDRTVDRAIVIDKWESIQTSFDLVAPSATEVYVINND